MIYHVTIFIAIAAVFFETAIANMTVTFPGGPDQWWVYDGSNYITWTCGGSPVVTFDIVLANRNPKIYPPTLLFADMDNSYDCSDTVFPQTDNTPLGTGYIVQLVVDPFSSLNSTYGIYVQSQSFEIKSSGSNYPSATPTATVTPTGPSTDGASSSSAPPNDTYNGAVIGGVIGFLVFLAVVILGIRTRFQDPRNQTVPKRQPSTILTSTPRSPTVARSTAAYPARPTRKPTNAVAMASRIAPNTQFPIARSSEVSSARQTHLASIPRTPTVARSTAASPAQPTNEPTNYVAMASHIAPNTQLTVARSSEVSSARRTQEAVHSTANMPENVPMVQFTEQQMNILGILSDADIDIAPLVDRMAVGRTSNRQGTGSSDMRSRDAA